MLKLIVAELVPCPIVVGEIVIDPTPPADPPSDDPSVEPFVGRKPHKNERSGLTLFGLIYPLEPDENVPSVNMLPLATLMPRLLLYGTVVFDRFDELNQLNVPIPVVPG